MGTVIAEIAVPTVIPENPVYFAYSIAMIDQLNEAFWTKFLNASEDCGIKFQPNSCSICDGGEASWCVIIVMVNHRLMELSNDAFR